MGTGFLNSDIIPEHDGPECNYVLGQFLLRDNTVPETLHYSIVAFFYHEIEKTGWSLLLLDGCCQQ